jgi:hypothetical protein
VVRLSEISFRLAQQELGLELQGLAPELQELAPVLPGRPELASPELELLERFQPVCQQQGLRLLRHLSNLNPNR